jgi:sulfite exporter TauE/SafE
MLKSVISIFILGLSFGSGPCMASCGPILISYIAGTGKGPLKGFISYVVFSLARLVAYTILGLLVFFLGRFAEQRLFSGVLFKYLIASGGVFIIITGVLMLAGRSLEFKLCRFLYRNILERDKKSLFIFGLVVGLLPCAPLLATLFYAGLTSKSWPESALYGMSFGLGTFISPLAILAGLAGFLPRLMHNLKAVYCRIFSFICGLIIIFLGVQLLRKVF